MTNSVNSFRHLDELFAKVLGQAAEDFLGYDDREEYEERPHVRIPKKPSDDSSTKTSVGEHVLLGSSLILYRSPISCRRYRRSL